MAITTHHLGCYGCRLVAKEASLSQSATAVNDVTIPRVVRNIADF